MSKQPFSNYTLHTAASAVLPSTKIVDIAHSVKARKDSEKHSSVPSTVKVNSGLLSISKDFFIPPVYTEHPPIH